MQQAVNMRRFQPAADLVAIAHALPGSTAMHDPAAAGVTIYSIPPSLCSQRVRMALIEKGVCYIERTIDTAAGENLEPAYLNINPRGVVPTMRADFSLADIGMTPYVVRCEQLQMTMMFEGRPALREWLDRVRARSSFGTAMESWYNPDYLALSEAKGRECQPIIAPMLEVA